MDTRLGALIIFPRGHLHSFHWNTYLSMTSLLKHDVAHSTRHSFRPKTNNHPLKKFLRGWLLVLGLKEGLVECATVCIKSEVILNYVYGKEECPFFLYLIQIFDWCDVAYCPSSSLLLLGSCIKVLTFLCALPKRKWLYALYLLRPLK